MPANLLSFPIEADSNCQIHNSESKDAILMKIVSDEDNQVKIKALTSDI